MKNLFILLLLTFVNLAHGQECGSYFAFKKGTRLELTNYDKKDRPTSVLKYNVVDYKLVNGGASLVFDVETYDENGKLLAKGQSQGKCIKGDYYTDVRNISSDMIPKSADITMSITGDQLTYPARMNTGDKLKEANINIKSGLASGMTLMNATITITDRQVAGTETVTTPAGTFECVKITYTVSMRLLGNRTSTGAEYIAPGVGMVKTEQFDSKGRRTASTMLTKREL